MSSPAERLPLLGLGVQEAAERVTLEARQGRAANLLAVEWAELQHRRALQRAEGSGRGEAALPLVLLEERRQRRALLAEVLHFGTDAVLRLREALARTLLTEQCRCEGELLAVRAEELQRRQTLLVAHAVYAADTARRAATLACEAREVQGRAALRLDEAAEWRWLGRPLSGARTRKQLSAVHGLEAKGRRAVREAERGLRRQLGEAFLFRGWIIVRRTLLQEEALAWGLLGRIEEAAQAELLRPQGFSSLASRTGTPAEFQSIASEVDMLRTILSAEPLTSAPGRQRSPQPRWRGPSTAPTSQPFLPPLASARAPPPRTAPAPHADRPRLPPPADHTQLVRPSRPWQPHPGKVHAAVRNLPLTKSHAAAIHTVLATQDRPDPAAHLAALAARQDCALVELQHTYGAMGRPTKPRPPR